MSSRYQARSVTAVSKTLIQVEQSLANDQPSDDEENNEEAYTDAESEEDADDSTFETPTEVGYQEESETEDADIDGPSPSKRGRPASHTTHVSSQDRKPSFVTGKDGHQWCTTAQEGSLHDLKNVTTYLPGPIGEARTVRSPLDAWSLLFTDALLKKVVRHTNEEIHRWRDDVESEAVSLPTYNDMNLCEFKALIGLLYFSGLQKASSTSLEDLWSHKFGSILYRSAMSLKRFKFLLRMIRFDDKSTRAARRETDKLAPIREIWEEFISNCTRYYSPSSYCTIDEQLLSFSGRCAFKVHNRAKPDKHGMKIVMLNDSQTFYMHTAEPYVGTVEKEDAESVPSYYIRKLSEPLHGTGRNITCDNRFSSVDIFDTMLSKYSMTMVGAIRKNERQIPDSFKSAAPINSSTFLFDETKTLVKYTPRKNKFVLVMSSFHFIKEADQDMEKPAIVLFYDNTKGGTDFFDHMCHEYSTARKTLRWPLRFWFGMLDQGGINAMVLHNFNGANANLIQREFLKGLVSGLIEPQLRVRVAISTLRRDLRVSIETILEEQAPPPRSAPADKKVARCVLCPRVADRKVRTYCERCHRPACEEHRVVVCSNCSVVE
ncbi:uncharacterized protein LOC117180849 [Belonocnema kinseyi]|uniref:uncharacterized protein LOC117180849 n=1 Tax=Belonocnema kinseyi TaxID=2817044 RepID=UPI00143D28B1|nr:uncharacterized protein LOC117180849 [Belonocnema kinseyi]